MELIDKELITKELKRRIDFSDKLADAAAEKNLRNTMEAHELLIAQYGSLLDFLDTLEVKEVDCEREIGIYTTKELLKKRNHSTGVFHLTQTDINSIAKHFFELGLKANK